MIDSEGYRANIGIVITNDKKQILLAKRYRQDAWQLPQGGIDKGFDMDTQDAHGNTLLLIACQNVNRGIVEMLVRRSAKINHQPSSS